MKEYNSEPLKTFNTIQSLISAARKRYIFELYLKGKKIREIAREIQTSPEYVSKVVAEQKKHSKESKDNQHLTNKKKRVK